jgi:tRNA (mo5U34)-methyltransferase
MNTEEAKRLVASVMHWHHKFEIFPGVTTPGSYDPWFLWNYIHPTREWSGARVIDIGPADGAFSKWAAERGAVVTALDYRTKGMSGFGVMEELSGRSFDFHVGNVLDAPSMGLGTFDAVLFLGVLYHLPDPLHGLYACRQLCRDNGSLYLETWFDPGLIPDVPAVRYIPFVEGADWTNFWVPNRNALLEIVRDVGFEVVRDHSWGSRIFMEARATSDEARARRMGFSYAQNVEGR